MGFLNYELEDFEEAVKNFNKALELVKDVSFIYFLLGNSYSRIGNIIEAIKCYDLAIFNNIDIYAVHIDFAKKYEEIGSPEKALQEYTAAYEIDPRDKEIEQKIKSLKEKINKYCNL